MRSPFIADSNSATDPEPIAISDALRGLQRQNTRMFPAPTQLSRDVKRKVEPTNKWERSISFSFRLLFRKRSKHFNNAYKVRTNYRLTF
jgi:hypothetical protein